MKVDGGHPGWHQWLPRFLHARTGSVTCNRFSRTFAWGGLNEEELKKSNKNWITIEELEDFAKWKHDLIITQSKGNVWTK